MSVFDILAGVGQVARDVFILLALLGSALLLGWRAMNLFTSRRRKAPELVVCWAYLGWLLGVICLGSFVIAKSSQPFGSFLLKLTVPAAAGVLLLALLLMVAAKILDGVGNRRRGARRPVVARQG